MPTAADGSIVLVTHRMYHDGQEIIFTMHYKSVVEPFGGTWDQASSFTAWQIINEAFGGLTASYLDCLSQDVIGLNVFFQAITSVRYSAFKYLPAVDVGQVATGSMPPNVAHAITMRGDLAGRHNKGTKHIGGVPDTFTESGLMTAAGLAKYNGLRDAMVVAVDVFGDASLIMEPIVFNRAAPGTSVRIANGDPQPTTRVERRRTVGLGT